MSALEGTVEAALPKLMYRVRTESGRTFRATLSSEAKRTLVSLIPGDRVLLSPLEHDPTRARILQKLR